MIGLFDVSHYVEARVKLVALPEREETSIKLDHPSHTLIEEERVLTLQKGVNQVDFSWKGVSIDEDSIRLLILGAKDVQLLNVTYPPGEAALVWEVSSPTAREQKVRISYLLNNIDRLVTYKAIANKEETELELSAYLILRNFSGEDFKNAKVVLRDDDAYRQDIQHEETKQILLFKRTNVPIRKIWTFDAAKLPWDPGKQNQNVGIPVSYEISNDLESGFKAQTLWAGKVRVFQRDDQQNIIFLGEDKVDPIPFRGKGKIYIGDSRDLVVTQRKTKFKKINLRRNHKNRIVLYDTDEIITAEIENFKNKPVVLTMIQHIHGQWDMAACNLEYQLKDSSTLEFEIKLLPQSKKTLKMNYHRRHLRH